MTKEKKGIDRYEEPLEKIAQGSKAVYMVPHGKSEIYVGITQDPSCSETMSLIGFDPITRGELDELAKGCPDLEDALSERENSFVGNHRADMPHIIHERIRETLTPGQASSLAEQGWVVVYN